MTDLLAVELALRDVGKTIEQWDEAYYKPLPSVQIKLPIEDRSMYKTTWDETKLFEPIGLQVRIDALVKDIGYGARAFVR